MARAYGPVRDTRNPARVSIRVVAVRVDGEKVPDDAEE
jgi:hypothetical protein